MGKLTIYGQVPSLKNAKKISINRRTGKRFVRTEQRVVDYMESAKLQIRAGWHFSPVERLESLTCVFYNRDMRSHDLSNQLDTICDVLKGILVVEDSQFCMPEITVRYGGVDRQNPRVELLFVE